MKHNHKPILLTLGLLTLTSCGTGTSTSSSAPISMLYLEPEEHQYSLADSPEYGTAIYPDEAMVLLQEIESHNRENGVPWPSGAMSSSAIAVTIDGEKLAEYAVEEETYVPNSYYYRSEAGVGWLELHVEAFFEEDGEFLYGKYDNRDVPESYYETSSVRMMEYEHEDRSWKQAHYEEFVEISHLILEGEDNHVSSPYDFSCYTSGEGSLYMNIYHQFSSPYDIDRRIIRRIVYKDYLPVFAVNQMVDDILGGESYRNASRSVSFTYGEVEIHEDLKTFFGERRGE